jgi:uncharacterized tellurite resistance protein B-like protein
MFEKQLHALAGLGSVDGHLSEKELRFVKMLAKVNGMSDEEFERIVANPEPAGDLGTLSPDQKFEFIYSLVQLMKADGQVFKSEIDFCERIAEELGYKKAVIGELSSKIYSDPAITTDRERLKQRAQKYLQ